VDGANIIQPEVITVNENNHIPIRQHFS